MAFPNFFKKREKGVEEKEKAKETPSFPNTTADKKATDSKEKKNKEKPIEAKISKEKKSDLACRFLKSPHVTEKATDLTKQNQYIFKVWPEVNKPEVKKAVENLYGVNVVSVKIINVPSKIRRLGKIKGQRKGYKKTIVKIREGQKIEVLPR